MIPFQAQTGALNEVSNAVDRLSAQGFWGLIILLTLIGSLVIWNVYADKKRYDKSNDRERERWDKQMENWKGVYDDQRGAFDELKQEIRANTTANDRVSDSFVRYAEHQAASGQETAKRNREILITFSDVQKTLAEVTKTMNRQAEGTQRLSDNTSKQLEIVSKQSDQNAATLELVKALANELAGHEKAAISRSEQIHIDFEQMRKDRHGHLDEMNKRIEGIESKMDTLIDCQQRLMEAVTVLIKRATDEHPAVPAEGSAAA